MAKDKDGKGKRMQDDPAPINVDKCTDIASAVMGQQIIFTNITGSCTISPGNTQWPFDVGPNIVFPNIANPIIRIKQGLSITPPNNVYQYVVSCCTQQQATKSVTVTG